MATSAEQRFARLAAYAQAVGRDLDRRNYYELLDVPATADPTAIRSAFYRMAADLHPDRYHAMGDAATRDQLATIYARISEGYRVLTNPEKRALYDKGLPGGKTRYLSGERKGPPSPEDAVHHPEAKKFFRLATIAMARQDWKGAMMNFKFARNFEPDSEAIANELAAVELLLKGFK